MYVEDESTGVQTNMHTEVVFLSAVTAVYVSSYPELFAYSFDVLRHVPGDLSGHVVMLTDICVYDFEVPC